MKDYPEGTFDINELKTICSHHESLKDNNVSIIAGLDAFKESCREFSEDREEDYVSFNIYTQGNGRQSHKLCIIFVQNEGDKVAFISDSTDAATEGILGAGLLRKEMPVLRNMLDEGQINAIYVNKFKRLGSSGGCGGFAVSDLMYYSNNSEFTQFLQYIEIIEDSGVGISFYDLPYELVKKSHFVNLKPESECSIARYIERNVESSTGEVVEMSQLSDIPSPNKTNDMFILEMRNFLKDIKKPNSRNITPLTEFSPLLDKSEGKKGSCFDEYCIIS